MLWTVSPVRVPHGRLRSSLATFSVMRGASLTVSLVIDWPRRHLAFATGQSHLRLGANSKRLIVTWEKKRWTPITIGRIIAIPRLSMVVSHLRSCKRLDRVTMEARPSPQVSTVCVVIIVIVGMHVGDTRFHNPSMHHRHAQYIRVRYL